MQYKQLDIFKNAIYLLTALSLIVQISLYKNFNDIFCILIIFISNIITIYYCLNKKYFFYFPISLMVIFISHFINLGGALYLKTVELSLLTNSLQYPLSTISNLFFVNIILIFAHSIYKKNINFLNLSLKIRNLLKKYKFYDYTNINFFYFLAFIAILSKFSYFDFSSTLQEQTLRNQPLYRDLLAGFRFFIFLPVILVFFKYLTKTENNFKINNFFIFFFYGVIFLYSLSINNRSLFFDSLLLLILIFLLLFFLDLIIIKKLSFKIFILIILIFPSINFIEKISTNFLIERTLYKDRTIPENIKSFGAILFSNKNQENYIKNLDYLNSLNYWNENYYSNSALNRINILLIHDNFNNIGKNISQKKIETLKNIQLNKLLTIFPQPIIDIFNNKYDKTFYNSFSTASYLYGDVVLGETTGRLKVGSALFILKIIFGNMYFLIILIFFIPFFILFDSFYNSENKSFSPYIILLFYSTSLGLFNFVAAPDISTAFHFIFRALPEVLFFTLISRFIFEKFFKNS